MGQWRLKLHLLLPALAVLAPLSSGTEITRTFTTTFPTTAIVTSSSAITGCSVSPSAQITCNNGFYNTYGAVWQETCAATVTGGALILALGALSLRACMSACAVRPACSATYYDGSTCVLLSGEVNIIPGGSVQAAMRYEATASPCVSTWLATETGTGTSTWESVYIGTPSSTPIVSPTGTSSLELVISTPFNPSGTASGTPTPSLTPSAQVTTPLPTSSSSSRPVIQSSSPLTLSPVSSLPVQPSSTLLISTLAPVFPVSPSVTISSISSSVIPLVTLSRSFISFSPSISDPLPTGSIPIESPSSISSSSSSPVSLAMSSSAALSVPSISSSGGASAGPRVTGSLVSVTGTSSVPTIPIIPVSTHTMTHSPISRPAFNRTLAVPHSLAISTSKISASPSGSSQRTTQTTTMNTVSWQEGPLVTGSAPGSLFNGGASQMAGISASVVVALFSMIFVL